MAMTTIRSFGSCILAVMVVACLLISEDALAKKKGKKKGGKKGKAPVAAVQEPTPQEKARAHYTKGKELYETGDFQAALTEFQAAYDTKAHPTVLKSIAECQVQLGELAVAVETFEKYLADPESAEKAAIETRVAEINKTPMGVSITSIPDGAAISIAGTEIEGVTPATSELTPGEYVVTLTVEGYEPIAKSITVTLAGPNELTVDFSQEGQPTPTEIDGMETLEDDTGITGEEGAKDEKKDGITPAFWAMAAVAGAGVISGSVFGTFALQEHNDYKTDKTEERQDKGKRYAIITDVSFGVAGAAGIAAIVLLVTDRVKKKKARGETARVMVTPVAGKKTFGLGAKVSF